MVRFYDIVSQVYSCLTIPDGSNMHNIRRPQPWWSDCFWYDLTLSFEFLWQLRAPVFHLFFFSQIANSQGSEISRLRWVTRRLVGKLRQTDSSGCRRSELSLYYVHLFSICSFFLIRRPLIKFRRNIRQYRFWMSVVGASLWYHGHLKVISVPTLLLNHRSCWKHL